VVVLGSANVDLVVQVSRRPLAGETVLGGDVAVLPGGKGANQAAAAGWLGGDVHFAGCVGDDLYGEMLGDSLSGAGVDTSRLRRIQSPTGMAFITVADGDNSIVVSPGANYQVTASDVDGLADLLTPSSVLVLQLELPVPIVERAAVRAVRCGARVLLNLAPATEVSQELLTSTDVLVVNESEAAFLVGGVDGWPAVSDRLRELGPENVVVTLGSAGALVNAGGHVSSVPAPIVQAVDTTGAGDAFVGALAVRLAAGADLLASTRFAVRAASQTVGRRGAQASYEVLGARGGG
jgi:ribokinase